MVFGVIYAFFVSFLNRANGKEYHCTWDLGSLEGEGVFVDATGRRRKGLWKDNKLVKWL